MIFGFLKFKKKDDSSRVLEGRIISDEEFNEMIRPKKNSFIKKQFDEIDGMMEEVRKYFE